MTQEDTKVDSIATEEENGSTATPAPETEPEASATVVPVANAPKKPLGTKEVIPFEWKLVGYTGGTAVTLFKAVDRQDVEVQYERILKDGYYKDLKILDINAKVVQPKKPKITKPPGEKKKSAATDDPKKPDRAQHADAKKAPAPKNAKKAKIPVKKSAKAKAPPKRTAKKK
jgi:hypothetical protein